MIDVTNDAMFAQLQAVIVDVLGVEAEEVVPTARWESDLGAESIDDLDLVFQIERQLGIRVPFQELGNLWKPVLTASGEDRQVALASFRERFPYLQIDNTIFECAGSTARNLLTVENIFLLTRESRS